MYSIKRNGNCILTWKRRFRLYQCNLQYSRPEKTYVGTYGNGLFIIDNQTNEITHCMANNSGLQTNNIYSIVPDKTGICFRYRKRTVFLQPERTDLYQLDTGTGIARSKLQSDCRNTYPKRSADFGSNEGVIILPDSLELPSSFSSHMVFSNLNIMYHPVHPMERILL